jgi:hypothetical protein
VATSTASPPPARTPSEQFRTVVRNGYSYKIDSRERTRRVFGVLTVADASVRSRTSQRQAGGAERRASDDGGHYIAARFNGPSEAFNHFAQDANFNRGGYRVLEMSGRERSGPEEPSRSGSFPSSTVHPFDHRRSMFGGPLMAR